MLPLIALLGEYKWYNLMFTVQGAGNRSHMASAKVGWGWVVIRILSGGGGGGGGN